MSTIALNKNMYAEAARQEARRETMSLKERIANYFAENRAEIVCGLLAMNGNADACRTYQMMREAR